MAQKLESVISKLLQKAGVSESVRTNIKNALSSVELEIEDDEAATINTSLMTATEAESGFMKKHKTGILADGRKEAWQAIDANNAKYYAQLSDEDKAKYDALKTTNEKTDFLLGQVLDGSAGNKALVALRKEYDKIVAERDSNYTPNAKYKELEDKYKPKAESEFFSKLTLAAVRNGKMSETAKNNRRFESNLREDFRDQLTKKGWIVDYETGKITDKEGLPVLKGTEEMTHNDILDEMINDIEDYQKKSNGKPTGVEIKVDVPKVNGNLSNAATKAFDQM